MLEAELFMRAHLEKEFPNLVGTDYQITSPAAREYNCIAWAAGEVHRSWWPMPGSYWPTSATRQLSTTAFIEAFQSRGFEVARTTKLERGLMKIAIYTKQQQPTHAARQLLDGTWTSKLGKMVDIMHIRLEHVSGLAYGYPYCIMSRPR